jgi:hypothetical protein
MTTGYRPIPWVRKRKEKKLPLSMEERRDIKLAENCYIPEGRSEGMKNHFLARCQRASNKAKLNRQISRAQEDERKTLEETSLKDLIK